MEILRCHLIQKACIALVGLQMETKKFLFISKNKMVLNYCSYLIALIMIIIAINIPMAYANILNESFRE